MLAGLSGRDHIWPMLQLSGVREDVEDGARTALRLRLPGQRLVRPSTIGEIA